MEDLRQLTARLVEQSAQEQAESTGLVVKDQQRPGFISHCAQTGEK